MYSRYGNPCQTRVELKLCEECWKTSKLEMFNEFGVDPDKVSESGRRYDVAIESPFWATVRAWTRQAGCNGRSAAVASRWYARCSSVRSSEST